MSLSEAEKLRIAEEERFREKVKKDINRVPWWKPKGIGAWLVTIFVILPLFIGFLVTATSSPQKQTSTSQEPQEKELKAYVNFDGTQFIISNVDKYTCQNSRMQVNGSYTLEGYDLESALDSTIKSGEAAVYKVGAGQFTKKDGTRFNQFTTKPQNFSISCRGNNELSSAFEYWEFK